MPAPGQPGRPSQRRDPGTIFGPGATAGAWSGLLGNRVGVQVGVGYGIDGRLVIAGQPGLTFGGGAQSHISDVTSTGTPCGSAVRQHDTKRRCRDRSSG